MYLLDEDLDSMSLQILGDHVIPYFLDITHFDLVGGNERYAEIYNDKQFSALIIVICRILNRTCVSN